MLIISYVIYLTYCVICLFCHQFATLSQFRAIPDIAQFCVQRPTPNIPRRHTAGSGVDDEKFTAKQTTSPLAAAEKHVALTRCC
jgi:hypothetical protein